MSRLPNISDEALSANIPWPIYQLPDDIFQTYLSEQIERQNEDRNREWLQIFLGGLRKTEDKRMFG